MKRIMILVAIASLVLAGCNKDNNKNEKAHHYQISLGGMAVEHLSENGRYMSSEGGDDAGIVYDLTRIGENGYMGRVYTMAEYPELESDFSFSMRGITNDGVPFAKGVSADGRITVRFGGGSDDKHGYVIIDGVEMELPRPAAPWKLYEDEWGPDYWGVLPDIVSADGKIILGRINCNGGRWIACKWEDKGSGYEFSELIPDELKLDENKEILSWAYPNSATGLSPNGKFSAGSIQSYNEFFTLLSTPYIHNMTTGTTIKMEGETDALGTFATDDGILFYASPRNTIGTERTPYVYENGVKKTFAAWVKENYGLTIENTGSVYAVSKDKKVVIWVTNSSTGWINNVIIAK